MDPQKGEMTLVEIARARGLSPVAFEQENKETTYMKTILVTGSAGFIGANLVKRLFTEMTEGTIIGVDNVNSYYDPSLKEYRLREIEKAVPEGIRYQFVRGSIADRELVNRLFREFQPDIVVNRRTSECRAKLAA